jgi:hypothetical protein
MVGARRATPTMARNGYDYEAAEMNAAAAAESITAAAASQPSTAWTPSGAESARSTSVRKQMEFWFSPSNLRRDWYLRRQMDAEGWLDPSIFLKFNRLKQLNVSLPEVIDACKGSSVLEVSAPPTDGSSFGDNLGQTRVRRSADLPAVAEELEAEAERSIVVEGLPEDVTLMTLRNMFTAYGDVTYSWISRPTSKELATHAIVSFNDTTTAMSAVDAFQASRPTGAPEAMTVKSKVLFDALASRRRNKSVIIQVSGLGPDMEWRQVWEEITAVFGDDELEIVYFLYKNGDEHCFVTVPDQASADAVMNVLSVDGGFKICGATVKPRILEEDDELDAYWAMASAQILERKRKKERYTRRPLQSQPGQPGGHSDQTPPGGVILHVQGLPEALGWQSLMSELKTYGEVIFLNFQKESTECHVRYADAATAEAAAEALSGDSPKLLLETIVRAAVLQGEEEEEYWQRAAEERRQKRARSARNTTARRAED